MSLGALDYEEKQSTFGEEKTVTVKETYRGKTASCRTIVSGKNLTLVCSAVGTSDGLNLETCFFLHLS